MAFIKKRESNLSDLISSKRIEMECPDCGGIMSLSEGGNLSSKSCPFCDEQGSLIGNDSKDSVKLNAFIGNSTDPGLHASLNPRWHSSYIKDKRTWMRRRKLKETILAFLNSSKPGVILAVSLLLLIIHFWILR